MLFCFLHSCTYLKFLIMKKILTYIKYIKETYQILVFSKLQVIVKNVHKSTKLRNNIFLKSM